MANRTFRNALPADSDRCYEIESTAYEGDEAATEARIATRIAGYPDGFLILEADDTIVGFINSGCAHEVEMSDDDFKELIGHDPDAPNVVIMSVVVDSAHQGQGHAKALMNEFIRHMSGLGKQTIHLMCQEHLVPFYGSFGCRYIRPSASDHGGKQWHEMILTL